MYRSGEEPTLLTAAASREVPTGNMSINDLLHAAELLEAGVRTIHAKPYSGQTMITEEKIRKPTPKTSPQPVNLKGSPMPPKTRAKRNSASRRSLCETSRVAHNELEKTRRANLRTSLERLRDIVQTCSVGVDVTDSTRNTTLSLLTRARNFIKKLEEQDVALRSEKSRLQDQQKLLRRHVELLAANRRRRVASTSRTHSESSVSTISVDLDSDVAPPSEPTRQTAQLTAPSPLDGLLPALPLFHPRLSLLPPAGAVQSPPSVVSTLFSASGSVGGCHRMAALHVPVVSGNYLPLSMPTGMSAAASFF